MSDEKAAYILVDVKITNNENYEKHKKKTAQTGLLAHKGLAPRPRRK